VSVGSSALRAVLDPLNGLDISIGLSHAIPAREVLAEIGAQMEVISTDTLPSLLA